MADYFSLSEDNLPSQQPKPRSLPDIGVAPEQQNFFSPVADDLDPTTRSPKTQDHMLWEQRRKELQEDAGFMKTLSLSFKNYNSIGSWMATQEGQQVYGYSDEEIEQDDPNFHIRNHRELINGIPLAYRKEIAAARNYKEAQVLRHRIMTRMLDSEYLAGQGFTTQLVAGIAASGLDPIAWLAGGAIGVGGKAIYGAKKAKDLKNIHDALMSAGRIQRTAYIGAQGAVIGAGSAAAQFGVMSTYDAGVNADVVNQEIAAGAIGGAIVPPLVTGAVGLIRGGTSSRVPLPEGYDELGPVAKFVKERILHNRAIDVPGAIGGDTPYRMAAATSPKSAAQVFEQGAYNVTDGVKVDSAELEQAIMLRKHLQNMDYNGYLEEFIGVQLKWYNRYKKSWKLHTHSDMKRDFEKKLRETLYVLEEGSELPDISDYPTKDRDLWRTVNDAAQTIFKVLKDASTEMAEAGVRNADDQLGSGFIVPKTINSNQLTNVIDGRKEYNLGRMRSDLSEGEELAADAAQVAEAEALRFTRDNIASIIRKNILDELIVGSAVGGKHRFPLDDKGNFAFDREGLGWLEEMIGRPLRLDEKHRLANAISHGYAEGLTEGHMKKSLTPDHDVREAIDAALKARVDTDFLTGLFTHHPELITEEVFLKDRLFSMFTSRDVPYGTHLLDKYFKSNPVHTTEYVNARADLNNMMQMLDDDLYGVLRTALSARTGQTALARKVEIPDAVDPTVVREGEFILSETDWLEASDIWRRHAQQNNKPYSPQFWEDTFRAFVGEPTRHNTGGPFGPVMRRVLTGAQQSTLGMAGFSQLSDVSNIIARGWWGKTAAVETIPHIVMRGLNREHKLKGSELIADIETLIGDTTRQWWYERGDFHNADFSGRDPNFLKQMSNPVANFSPETMGKWYQGIGGKIDQVQAFSSRLLGAMSGMNSVTQYLALAGQKSLIREFDVMIKKLDGMQFSKKDMGLLRQLGVSIEDLQRLKIQWDKVQRFGDNPKRGIQSLNVEQWDPLEVAWFSRKMERGMGFIMGTATRGELPRRLDNPYFAAVLQNRRYSMGAHEKALRGGFDIGAGHMFHHMGAAMAIGMTAVMLREVLKDPDNLEYMLDEEPDVIFRRALSSAPVVGNITDTASMVYAPLVSFYDTDIANNMHFGYNRYNKGPARGGLDTMLEQIPSYQFTKDGLLAFQNYFTNYDEDNAFKEFTYDLMKVSPPPLGNTIGSLVLEKMFDLEED